MRTEARGARTWSYALMVFCVTVAAGVVFLIFGDLPQLDRDLLTESPCQGAEE